jgi:hypothetical protein
VSEVVKTLLPEELRLNNGAERVAREWQLALLFLNQSCSSKRTIQAQIERTLA